MVVAGDRCWCEWFSQEDVVDDLLGFEAFGVVGELFLVVLSGACIGWAGACELGGIDAFVVGKEGDVLGAECLTGAVGWDDSDIA